MGKKAVSRFTNTRFSLLSHTKNKLYMVHDIVCVKNVVLLYHCTFSLHLYILQEGALNQGVLDESVFHGVISSTVCLIKYS